jgi:hypothetical protein
MEAHIHVTVLPGQLNAADGENLLGYDIYSSALADILSDPALNTPITVGLYAKWGSGKSFLPGKFRVSLHTGWASISCWPRYRLCSLTKEA